MTSIPAATLRVGDIVQAQMGYKRQHSRTGMGHKAWMTARWKITEVRHTGTVHVAGVHDDGTEGQTEFYRDNQVELVSRAS